MDKDHALSVYTMEYYLSTKKNEIWSLTATGMAQEDITLRGQNRTQKDACHVFSNINVDLMEVDNGVTASLGMIWVREGWREDG